MGSGASVYKSLDVGCVLWLNYAGMVGSGASAYKFSDDTSYAWRRVLVLNPQTLGSIHTGCNARSDDANKCSQVPFVRLV